MMDPRTLGAKCDVCPFNGNCKPVMPEGNPRTAKGILMGESPGKVEADTERPFNGPTGSALDDELTKVGLNRGHLVVMNGIACLPSVEKKEADMRAAADACRPMVMHFLSQNPSIPVLAMGKWAFYAVTGKLPPGGVEKARGFVRTVGKRILISTYHPTNAFFYNPWVWGDFNNDLRRFRRATENRLRKRPEIIIDPSPRQVREIFQSWGGNAAVDIETAPADGKPRYTGKDPMQARLKVLGFGNPDVGASFVWEEASRALRNEVFRLVNEHVTVWQNGPWFDLRCIPRFGFTFKKGNIIDIRDERKALVTTSKLSLRYMASLYDDAPPWKEGVTWASPEEAEDDEAENEDVEDDDKGLMFADDPHAQRVYNATDCVETARVHEGLIADEDWPAPRVQHLYREHLEMSFLAAEMNSCGFFVDAARRGRLSEVLKTQHDKRLAKLKKHVVETLKADWFGGKPDDLRALLFRRHESETRKGFSLPDPPGSETKDGKKRWTKTGKISVNANALLPLLVDPSIPQDAKDIVFLYQDAAQPKKADSTFISSEMVTKAIGEDGRLRTGWNSCGPDTGRWAARDPNIMNLPESKE